MIAAARWRARASATAATSAGPVRTADGPAAGDARGAAPRHQHAPASRFSGPKPPTCWHDRATRRRGVRCLVGAPRGLAVVWPHPPRRVRRLRPLAVAARAAADPISCRSSTAAASTTLRPLLARLDAVRQVCERLLTRAKTVATSVEHLARGESPGHGHACGSRSRDRHPSGRPAWPLRVSTAHGPRRTTAGPAKQ